MKLISLLLKIWKGGMFQLLGKAHGSQDLLNPNPLRQQVCLNSFKALFHNSGSAVEEEKSRGWVTTIQNQQVLTQKYCLCLNHPCLGCGTGFISMMGPFQRASSLPAPFWEGTCVASKRRRKKPGRKKPKPPRDRRDDGVKLLFNFSWVFL